MPESVSTCSAYKMLTCIYLCRTLLFFAPYADFSEKKALAFLYKLEKATTELAVLNRQVIELTNECKELWLPK